MQNVVKYLCAAILSGDTCGPKSKPLGTGFSARHIKTCQLSYGIFMRFECNVQRSCAYKHIIFSVIIGYSVDKIFCIGCILNW